MTEPVEQIPWALMTKVTYKSDMSVMLERENAKADIWHQDFEWSISLNSRSIIKDFFTLNQQLTRDIQDHFAVEGTDDFEKNVRSWLKSGAPVKLLPRTGPKEWRPPSKARTAPWILKGDWDIGNTYNDDPAYWWGDKFQFANFETDELEDGTIIAWEGRDRYPEVYIGSDFEGFISDQNEGDPYSKETFLRQNSAFENGFMWAWEKMGVFDDPADHIRRLKDDPVKGVLAAIEEDPSILLPESVEKILRKFSEFPIQIQKAATWIMNNHKRDLEKALGQKLIWGDLYAE